MIEVTWEFSCDECGCGYYRKFRHSQLLGIGFHVEADIPALNPCWRIIDGKLICPKHEVKIITPNPTPL
mgnify:CR=1 FL=1